MAEKPKKRVIIPVTVAARPVRYDPRKSGLLLAEPVRRFDHLRPAAVVFDAARPEPVKDRGTCKERPSGASRSRRSGGGGRQVDFIPWCS